MRMLTKALILSDSPLTSLHFHPVPHGERKKEDHLYMSRQVGCCSLASIQVLIISGPPIRTKLISSLCGEIFKILSAHVMCYSDLTFPTRILSGLQEGCDVAPPISSGDSPGTPGWWFLVAGSCPHTSVSHHFLSHYQKGWEAMNKASFNRWGNRSAEKWCNLSVRQCPCCSSHQLWVLR